jgi:hypothetical protein
MRAQRREYALKSAVRELQVTHVRIQVPAFGVGMILRGPAREDKMFLFCEWHFIAKAAAVSFGPETTHRLLCKRANVVYGS